MRYENTINPKLAISRIIVSLPRNALCHRNSKPHLGGESSDEQEAGEEEDEPASWQPSCGTEGFQLRQDSGER